MEKGPQKEPTIADALVFIAAVEQRIRVTGAVDTEPNALAQLRDLLVRKEIMPQEAMRRAEELERGRQDYH